MVTNGEYEIDKVVCIGSHNYNIMRPCGACRELMMQLSINNKKAKILTDIKNKKYVTLEKLLSDWWK